MIELNFLVELVNYLLVVYGDVSVSISQVIQNVPEMRAIPINEVSTILVFLDIMPPRKHRCQHRIRIPAR